MLDRPLVHSFSRLHTQEIQWLTIKITFWSLKKSRDILDYVRLTIVVYVRLVIMFILELLLELHSGWPEFVL